MVEYPLWWYDNDKSMEYLPADKYCGKVWLIVGIISKAEGRFLILMIDFSMYFYVWMGMDIYLLYDKLTWKSLI